MNYNLLGSKIKVERNKRGMSQDVLSELADITQKYLSLIETGKRTPKLNVIIKLASALGVTVDYLVLNRVNIDNTSYIEPVVMRMKTMSETEQAYILRMVELYFEHRTNNFNP